jgi:hypothetical protein
MNTKEWVSNAYKIFTSYQNLSPGPHSDMSIFGSICIQNQQKETNARFSFACEGRVLAYNKQFFNSRTYKKLSMWIELQSY